MARETKAQKAARVGLLLADYDAVSRDLRKLEKRAAELKAEIRDSVEPGTYGEWNYSEGTPREILDQPAARKLITEHGLEVPTVMTKPAVVVKPIITTK